jgi:hypothetical protein
MPAAPALVLTRCQARRRFSEPRTCSIRVCCGVVPARRIVPGLLCDFCSSARQSPLACLPTVGCPSEVGFEWWLLHVAMTGPPTSDLHPFNNAPMLGVRKGLVGTLASSRPTAPTFAKRRDA